MIDSSGDFEYEDLPTGEGVVLLGFSSNFKSRDKTGAFHKRADFVFPDELDGKPILRIGERAFSRRDSLTAIQLPSRLKEVGRLAFAFCGALTNVKVPTQVRKIEFAAFSFCNNLEIVNLPPTVQEIDEYAFATCPIRALVLHEGLLSIGSSAFMRCEKLEYIRVPASVLNIGDGAFAGIPGTLDVASDNPYYKSVADMLLTKDDKKLISYPGGALFCEIPDGVEEIARRAFLEDRSAIKLPKRVKIIPENAFDLFDNVAYK